jgi:ABC-type amino acid transport substrate-binding protein
VRTRGSTGCEPAVEPGLLNFLNAWIAYWKADGWLDERRHYWFETLEWTSRFDREGTPK